MKRPGIVTKHVVGALAALGVALVTLAPVANATASGTNVLGCQAQVFNTAFSTQCRDTQASGSFRTTAMCQLQPTVSGSWQWVGAGSNVNGVSAGQCTIRANSAQTTFSG